MYIKSLLRYVKDSLRKTKNKHPYIDDKILKSALVYQYLHCYYFQKDITILEILETEGYDLGMIGLGKGRLTRILEFLFGWSNVFSSHAILHDAFGRFYNRHNLGEGYTYCLKGHVPIFMKKSPFFGHVTGLNYCALKQLVI